MKELAVDESLSEETRESAQKALDELVSAQIGQVSAHTEIKKLEDEAQLKRQRVEAKKMLVSDDMVEWLGQHRLQECAADLARIAGAYAHEREGCCRVVASDCWALRAGACCRATYST